MSTTHRVRCTDGVERTFTARPAKYDPDKGFVRIGDRTISGWNFQGRFDADTTGSNSYLLDRAAELVKEPA